MTQTKYFITWPIQPGVLFMRMLPGAVIGLLVICFFIFQVDHPRASWGQYWMVRPLIVVPCAGAAGGAFYYFMGNLRNRGGWKKVLANLASFFVFIIGLWMGIVLGLSGTLWH